MEETEDEEHEVDGEDDPGGIEARRTAGHGSEDDAEDEDTQSDRVEDVPAVREVVSDLLRELTRLATCKLMSSTW